MFVTGLAGTCDEKQSDDFLLFHEFFKGDYLANSVHVTHALVA